MHTHHYKIHIIGLRLIGGTTEVYDIHVKTPNAGTADFVKHGVQDGCLWYYSDTDKNVTHYIPLTSIKSFVVTRVNLID